MKRIRLILERELEPAKHAKKRERGEFHRRFTQMTADSEKQTRSSTWGSSFSRFFACLAGLTSGFRLIAFGILIIFFSFGGHLFADTEQEWSEILALDAGPKGEIKTREQARALTLPHLEVQEMALRQFIASHPDDPRCVDARLRLAHLLATSGDLHSNKKGVTDAMHMLDDLERGVPPERKADVAFARIALLMRRMPAGDVAAREALMERVVNFQKAYPLDRRVAPLLVEMATAYDSLPRKKAALLYQAVPLTNDEGLKQRIDDDLKRVAMLGRPLKMEFVSIQGEPVNVEQYHGKVVVIVFFADWSPPSLETLVELQRIVKPLPSSQVQMLGVSLDENKDTLLAVLKERGIDWPVCFDGKSWESPMVRPFGINALPTVWVLDRAGALRTLNARYDAASLIRELVKGQ